jgi:ribosomal-protein-alanine N-acetyltransferase
VNEISSRNEIRTPRLTGVAAGLDHFADLRSIHGDARAMATLSADGKILSDEQTREFLERAADHWRLHGCGLWVFGAADYDNDFVGYCGIRHARVEDRDEIELAYAVQPKCWGLGFATEMSEAALRVGFEDLKLERIVAFTLPHNLASRRVLERCGFTFQRDIVHAGLPHVLYELKRARVAAG